MKNKYPQSRKADIVVQEMDGETLIYNLIENKAFCLNETSALVWDLCDGNKSISEISQLLSQKLNLPANEDLVWLAIDQLKKEKLIENNDSIITTFNGMNRREVIRKVGLASMVVLPVITSIVAPSSIHAASGGCTPAEAGATTINAACTMTCQCNQFGNPGSVSCCLQFAPGTPGNMTICTGAIGNGGCV